MKKRLLCLMLCLAMVLSVLLTSCAEEEETPDTEEDTSAKTITMWVITDKETTQKAMDKVEAAFTKITKSRFKINVDLRFYTEDQYYTALEDTIKNSVDYEAKKELVASELNAYIQSAVANGEDDEAVIRESFFNEHPEYAMFKNYFQDVEDETGAPEDETIVNDLGITEIKYPDPEPYQVDIVYISGYQKYIEYIQADDGAGWLQSLDSSLSGISGKELNDYIASSLLNGVKIDGTTYAIPNNVAIGEYTYMMIDKELFDKYYYRYEDIVGSTDVASSGLFACDDFLSDIVNIENENRVENGETPVLPISSDFKTCMDMFVWYWNLGIEETNGEDSEGNPTTSYKYSYDNTNKFSLIGATYNGPASRTRGGIELNFGSLFSNPTYKNIFLKMKEYDYNGYFGTPEEGQQSAISFIKGDYRIREEFESNDGVYTDANGNQYYGIIAEYPEATTDDLYGNMYGVCAYSNYLSQSMQIITAINTDPELRNLLQYGIEGENYEIDENTGVLRRLNHDYMMDIEKTGNCFIAHPEEGLPADYWETAKVQNNETLLDPLLGFDFDSLLAETPDAKTKEMGATLDNDLITYVNMLSEQVYEKIEACETYEELYNLVNGNKELKIEGLSTTYSSIANPKLTLEDGTTVDVNMAKKFCQKAYDTMSAGGVNDEGEPIPDTTGESPYTVYYNWLMTYGYAP